jgi:cold shock CspA family protein
MSVVGCVRWFNAKKGYGFVTVMTQTVPQANTDVFVHFSNLNVSQDCYKRLFPGEYVSMNLGKGSDGRDICTDVSGVQGGKLLTENSEHFYRVTKRYDGDLSLHSESGEVSQSSGGVSPPEDDNDPEKQ